MTATVRLRPPLAEALKRRHWWVDRHSGRVSYTDPVTLPARRHTVAVPHWVDLDPDGGEFPFAGPVGYWCPGVRDRLAERGEQVHLYVGRYAGDGGPVFVRVFTLDGVPTGWAMGHQPQIVDHRYELAPVDQLELGQEEAS
jgi:hypothetical protein